MRVHTPALLSYEREFRVYASSLFGMLTCTVYRISFFLSIYPSLEWLSEITENVLFAVYVNAHN